MFALFHILANLFFSKKIQQILVVFQNNNELRGGGGFITQVLDISIGKAQLKLNFRHDHNDLQGDVFIEAPEDIKRYMHLQHWHLRDTNLFGSFSKNAQHISENYRTIYPNHQVAGVIAVNFSFVENLLKILGEITVQGKQFSAQNLFYELTNSVSNIDNHDVYVHNQDRKSILKSLFLKLIKKIILNGWKWPALHRLFRRSIKNKDIQLNFFEEKNQRKLIKKGFVENFSAEGAKDFLAIVENNYLGLKANRYLRRSVFHDVQFHFNPSSKTLSEATVKVKIRTEHFGSFNYPMSGTYQSVTNIFIPKSAINFQALSEGIVFDAEKEGDFQTLSCHKIIPIGGTAEIIFHYQLPAELFTDNTYSFRYFKQSGVHHEHLFETVSYPDQYELKVDSAQAVIQESKFFLNHPDLDNSYSYTVKGKFHFKSPRIFFHEIVGPEFIQVRFNEPVSFTKNSVPAERLKVVDVQNGQHYDIEKAYFVNDNRCLVIHVPQLPRLEECFYRVHLANIENRVGVLLHDKPREVTVVYRSRYYLQ